MRLTSHNLGMIVLIAMAIVLAVCCLSGCPKVAPDSTSVTQAEASQPSTLQWQQMGGQAWKWQIMRTRNPEGGGWIWAMYGSGSAITFVPDVNTTAAEMSPTGSN